MSNGLLERTMQSITAGKVGFDMTRWFDYLVKDRPYRTATYPEHRLGEVNLSTECKTVGCLAAHIALASGHMPDDNNPHTDCTHDQRGGRVDWERAALDAWEDAYPNADLVKLHEAFNGWHFDPPRRCHTPTLSQIERVLVECKGESNAQTQGKHEDRG